MTFKEPKGKWFKELKKNRKDFKNVGNIIEVAKFKYERDIQMPQWLIGIGMAVFLSINISGLIQMSEPWKSIGIAGFIISPIFLLVGMCLLLISDFRQQRAMSWLYREKDKQEYLSKK